MLLKYKKIEIATKINIKLNVICKEKDNARW